MKTVVLDAGHGMNTPGKRCLKTIDPTETREFYLNRRVAEYVTQYLPSDIMALYAHDPSGETDASLNKRVTVANTNNADLYIAIHHNAGINGGSGGGVCCFYYSSNPERLVQCQQLYEKIVAANGLRGNRATPVSKNHLYVLSQTKCPALYVENGFMDSTTDTPQILRESFAVKTAEAIASFIKEMLNVSDTGGTKYFKPCSNTCTGIAAALVSIGEDGSYANRKNRIAPANGFIGYRGTAGENIEMLTMLKNGLLVKP